MQYFSKALLAAALLSGAALASPTPKPNSDSLTLTSPLSPLSVRDGCTKPKDFLKSKKIAAKASCTVSKKSDSKSTWFDYVIKIDPTGQGSDGWCQGVWDNVKHWTGNDASGWESCNSKYNPRNIDGITYNGIEFRFNVWEYGLQNEVLISAEKGSCGLDLVWDQGGCVGDGGVSSS